MASRARALGKLGNAGGAAVTICGGDGGGARGRLQWVVAGASVDGSLGTAVQSGSSGGGVVSWVCALLLLSWPEMRGVTTWLWADGEVWIFQRTFWGGVDGKLALD